MPTLPPPPDQDAIVLDGKRKLFVTSTWLDWLLLFIKQLSNTALRQVAVSKVDLSASIGVTALLAAGTLSATIFRISVGLRVTQPATTSSLVSATIHAVDRGQAVTHVTPDLTNNSPALPASSTFLVRTDSPLFLTYSTTYATVGATPMKHQLDIVVEAVL